jgi:SecD/SecF fusion protein
MHKQRLIAFLAIIVIAFGAIAWTSSDIIKSVRLGLDLKGGFEILYEAEPIDEGKELTAQVLRSAAQSLERRANVGGVEEPEVLPELPNRIRVRLAGVENQQEIRDRLKEPAQLTFRSNSGCENPNEFCKIELDGNDFVENGASVQYIQGTNEPIVAIKLKDPDKFEEITRRLSAHYPGVGSVLAIYMDDEQLSAPTVQRPIPGGTAQIEGRFTYSEAERLAETINLGALPVKLTEKYTQSVGATLGKKALEETIRAGIVGSILVLLFMLAVYRVPGLVAGISIIIYSWLLLIVFNLMNATLTLPGIAAFVLGIGMAVDANIITAERIKEEIRAGKSILSSLRAGSRNSLSTILDANITTIIAGIALYFLGTGGIQGFALTLIFSILVSMVTNVALSRLLLNLLIRANVFRKPVYFGVKESEIRAL